MQQAALLHPLPPPAPQGQVQVGGGEQLPSGGGGQGGGGKGGGGGEGGGVKGEGGGGGIGESGVPQGPPVTKGLMVEEEDLGPFLCVSTNYIEIKFQIEYNFTKVKNEIFVLISLNQLFKSIILKSWLPLDMYHYVYHIWLLLNVYTKLFMFMLFIRHFILNFPCGLDRKLFC